MDPCREPPHVIELVERHIESLVVLDERGRLRAVNDVEGSAPPRLALVRSPAGHRCLTSIHLPDDLCREIVAVAELEPAGAEIAPWPLHRDAYRRLLDAHAPVQQERAGPAFVLPRREAPTAGIARLLDNADLPRLAAHFPWLADELDEAVPAAGVLADGDVVAVCRCARRRTAAVEAGIETAAAFRGRGFARAAAECWTAAMFALGLVPLYSTTWDNAASLRIARGLGGVQYAVDYSLG